MLAVRPADWEDDRLAPSRAQKPWWPRRRADAFDLPADADRQFTNSELQRHGMEVAGLLDNPNVRKFVDWVAKKEPDFNATIAKKQR